MSTSAYDAISAFATTIRTRITTNVATLGSIQQVLDRDEDPAILAANAKLLPTVCVIPLGAGKDVITFSMGSSDWQHEFQVFIVGYYRFSQDNKTAYSDIDTMRKYAFGLLELFRGSLAFFNGGNIYKATVEIKPYQEMDYVLDRFLITMNVKLIEV